MDRTNCTIELQYTEGLILENNNGFGSRFLGFEGCAKVWDLGFEILDYGFLFSLKSQFLAALI